MTEKRNLRALVVDDEAAVQRLLTRALQQQGFQCDAAADANEAEELVSRATYDAVVTDLRMPNKNGHALAVHLLTLQRRPIIVVHTGLIEPRLARDLIARGVDDILFKPCDFGVLAAKVRALVERQSLENNHSTSVSKGTDPSPQLHEDTDDGMLVSLANIESTIATLSRVLPFSTAGLDVYHLTSSDGCDVPQIAAAIQRDGTLAAEVLRLANRAFFNASGQQIIEMERAVVQIGQRRIGEVALATNAIAALTSGLVPLLNAGLSWKRSMAAGLAVEMLIDEGKYRQHDEGLLLSALMHPLGRVVLGTLYPLQYAKMIQDCQRTNESLIDHERSVFPINHAEVIARLLAAWGIPDEFHLPLKHVLSDLSTLCELATPVRIKVDLLTLAIYLGNLAVGEWESWDLVEVPPLPLLMKMGISRISEITTHINTDIEKIVTLSTNDPGTPLPPSSRELSYCDLSGAPFDFLGEIISSMGIKPVRRSIGDLNDGCETTLMNCIGVGPQQLTIQQRRLNDLSLVFVTDAEQAGTYSGYGRTIALPTSYGSLRTVCWESSHAVTSV